MAQILHRTLTVGVVEQHEWMNVQDDSDKGMYWSTIDDHGVTWLFDGQERMAALPARMFRFFHRGIARRRYSLMRRYLRGLIPIPHDAYAINFGANVGELAIGLSECGAQVLAIEPDPVVVPLLRANADGRAIEVVPVAAWNDNRLVQLYLKSDSADSSVFNESEERVIVSAQTIDAMIAARGIDRVHLIAGDAEGAEPEVLEGARETLKITDYVSVCASAERCGESTLIPCEKILRDSGFSIIHRDETGFCMLLGRR